MSIRHTKYLKELRLLDPIRSIENSLEWPSINKHNNLITDDNLVETLANIASLLEKNRYQDALPRALMAVLYLTGRIVDERDSLRREGFAINPLEQDLQLALILPGEEVNGLSIKWPDQPKQTSMLGVTRHEYAEWIRNILVQLNTNIAINKGHDSTLSLASLSLAYSALTSLIIN
ncbi:hypothetical protein [Pseudomonas sp. R5(2019)]|uniref:hypothetical protein n=1 Tax=Pseudomonas sp. R5(2019) TaxID=2697566 RepID=UPI001412C791|nr:hypothetical protein [Pseudomonas sp. R5(2019)]NBA94889.1 hypothetical protein [Pseudomonas sp. R5(2019)]